MLLSSTKPASLTLYIRFASGYGMVVDLECSEGEFITSGIYNFESIYGVINMAMKIEYVKIMDSGERMIKITGFHGIKTWDELPSEYRTSGVRVYDNGNALMLNASTRYFTGKYPINRTFTPEDFGAFICELKAAGHRLAEINKRIKADAAGWEGVTGEVII